MRRRAILGGIGSTLSVPLAGCADLVESIDNEGSEPTESNESTDELVNESSESTDDEQLYEDESVEGDAIIAESLSDSLSALRHTYTWRGEERGDECSVHVELKNTGDEEVNSDIDVRIYNENETELASVYFPNETSPQPGETGVYSFPLTNCAGTASYELEISEPGDGDGGSNASETPLIDDFEGYDSGTLPTAWTLDGGGDATVTADAALHEDSTQGLRQAGDSNVRSFPGQGLPNYPEDGREVSVLMRPSPDTAQPWILFGMEEDVWSTETPGWRLIIDPQGSIRIARETGSGAEILAEYSRMPSLVDETVDCRFVADSSNGIEFWIQDLDGTVLGYVSTDETEGIEDEMSIGFRSSQGVDWDWSRLGTAESGE
ncbi:hypothetical protein [Natronococcus wangiae]|uniref:hypothetical protein n=1 Tax=Natronococcus wangiae TaxID=3068275 RepID=UPI00273ED051|nr:hypothetical protein [Natronococcus sp. AD5]